MVQLTVEIMEVGVAVDFGVSVDADAGGKFAHSQTHVVQYVKVDFGARLRAQASGE